MRIVRLFRSRYSCQFSRSSCRRCSHGWCDDLFHSGHSLLLSSGKFHFSSIFSLSLRSKFFNHFLFAERNISRGQRLVLSAQQISFIINESFKNRACSFVSPLRADCEVAKFNRRQISSLMNSDKSYVSREIVSFFSISFAIIEH